MRKKIVQWSMIVTCLRRKTAAARNVKVRKAEIRTLLYYIILYRSIQYRSLTRLTIIISDCMYNGERFASGTEWSNVENPCISYKCVAGVVTESNVQCYTPCNNPLLPRPGQCCSTCSGKIISHLNRYLSISPKTNSNVVEINYQS